MRRREIELAAMYETRELQQQKSRAYTTPSSCETAQSVSDDVIAARRRLRDVGPPNSLSLRVCTVISLCHALPCSLTIV